MMNDVFIISKPLQYFNATNISVSNPKILLIVDGFNQAQIFFENVKRYSEYWDSVYFFNDYSSAFNWLYENHTIINSLFIDGDFGFAKYRYLSGLKTKNIFVFEEGVGTYTNDLRQKILVNIKKDSLPNKIKGYLYDVIYRLFGNKPYHGGSKFTKGVYVYDIEKRKKVIKDKSKEVHSFDNTFYTHLSKFKDRELLFPTTSEIIELAKGKKVLLYLTSWSVHKKIKEKLENFTGYFKIIKPHPYLENSVNHSELGFDASVFGGSMVEFLIKDLLEVSDEITVIHHGSGALLYFENAPKIKEILIR